MISRTAGFQKKLQCCLLFILLDYLYCEDGVRKLFRNFGNSLPVDTTLYPRIIELSLLCRYRNVVDYLPISFRHLFRIEENKRNFVVRQSITVYSEWIWYAVGSRNANASLRNISWNLYRPDLCTVLGYYAALSVTFVPTFRDNLSVPSSRVKKSWTLWPLKIELLSAA